MTSRIRDPSLHWAAKRAALLVVAALICGWAATADASCLPAEAGQAMTPAAKDTPFAVALTPRPAPIKVGTPFTIDLVVCSATGAAVERVVVDATMPAHRHGMNYKPEVVAQADGRYEARNFLFHMPGTWRIAVSVYAAGKPAHLSLGVEVK